MQGHTNNKYLNLSLSFAFLLGACSATAHTGQASWPESLSDQVGKTYKIVWTQSTETGGNAGSSGTSNSRNTLIETVLNATPNELILEYDMPDGTSDIDRRRSWQFPARVRLTPDNKMTLLNAEDLKERNEDWLSWGNYDRRHCDMWLFTWTAQKIECDPNSVLEELEPLNIRRLDLKDGSAYASSMGFEPVILTEQSSDDGMINLIAQPTLDSEKVRENRAKSNIIVAQILGEKAPTLEAELLKLQKETISGTIKVSYTLDEDGEPIKRVQINEITIINSDGDTETSKSTETVERKLLDKPAN